MLSGRARHWVQMEKKQCIVLPNVYIVSINLKKRAYSC